MKAWIASVYAFALCVSPSTAVDLVTPSKTYKDAVITQTNAAFIIVRHSGGISKVRIADLSAGDQSRFGYNSSAAADFELNEKTAADAKRAAEIEAKRRAAEIARERWKEANCRVVEGKLYEVSMMTDVIGDIDRVLPSGVIVQRVEKKYYRTGGGGGNGNLLTTRAPTYSSYEEFVDMVYVKCDPRPYSDGQRVKISAVPLDARHKSGSNTYLAFDAGEPYVSDVLGQDSGAKKKLENMP